MEPVRLVWFWLDHFSKEIQNIFQLTKNQMHGKKMHGKNSAWIQTLEYFENSKIE